MYISSLLIDISEGAIDSLGCMIFGLHFMAAHKSLWSLEVCHLVANSFVDEPLCPLHLRVVVGTTVKNGIYITVWVNRLLNPPFFLL
jgi:hypothetical protein